MHGACYPVSSTMTLCIDYDNNVTYISEAEDDDSFDLGPAIEILEDKEESVFIFYFLREDKTLTKIAELSPIDIYEMKYVEIGKLIVDSGYPMKPELAYFLGLFLKNWINTM